MRGRRHLLYRLLVLMVVLGLWMSLHAPAASAKSRSVDPILDLQGYTWSGGAMP